MRVNGSCKWRNFVNIGTGTEKSGKLWGNRGQFIGLMKKEADEKGGDCHGS